MSERPQWLDEFRRRTLLIDVIDEAFDPDIDDKTVRDHLREAAKELGDLFMPDEIKMPPGGRPGWRKKGRK